LAISSAGFDGVVDEVQFARMAAFMGSQYAVGLSTDLKPSVVSSADRTVAIAPGTAFGHGVLSVSDATVNLQGAIVTSGTRWDTVVLRRDWQAPGGTATFMLLQGSSTKLVATSRQNTPGVLDDQLIALVRFQAGQNLAQEIVDLRSWPAKVVLANDLAALPKSPLGTEAIVNGVRWRRELDASLNIQWVMDRTNIAIGVAPVEKLGTAAVSAASGWTLASSYTTRGLRIGNWIQLDISLRRTGADVNPGATMTVGSVAADLRPDVPTPVHMIFYSANGSYGGTLQVYPDGDLNTVSGFGGELINRRTSASDISVRAQAFYMVKGGA
jgi:hypothetical protein